MKHFFAAGALCLLLTSSSARAIPLPSKSSLISGIGGSALLLMQQRLFAACVTSLMSMAYCRTKVLRQGVFTRQALANVGLGALAPKDTTHRSLVTRGIAGLLSVGLLLANRAVFDYLFLDSFIKKYTFYSLYMTQVAQRSVLSLGMLEALYQGIAHVQKKDVQWVMAQVQNVLDKFAAAEPAETCPICMEEAGPDNPLVGYCSEPLHFGHEPCWQRWLMQKRDCPVCRESIAPGATPQQVLY